MLSSGSSVVERLISHRPWSRAAPLLAMSHGRLWGVIASITGLRPSQSLGSKQQHLLMWVLEREDAKIMLEN